MNNFLKTAIGVAYLASTANASYAAVPTLVSKDVCTANVACIADLSGYMKLYDGLTQIKDLGGPIETAAQNVYGNVPDGRVTRAEAVDPVIKFVFPSSRPELYRLEGYTSQVKGNDVDAVDWAADVLRMKRESADEFTAKGGAPSCNTVGSRPLRGRDPITAEEVHSGSLYGTFGGCRFQMQYDVAIRTLLEEQFQPYDVNKDGVISKADDRNKDNMITLEDTVLVK